MAPVRVRSEVDDTAPVNQPSTKRGGAITITAGPCSGDKGAAIHAIFRRPSPTVGKSLPLIACELIKLERLIDRSFQLRAET
jgi:hypothetical protein